jgi:hypothetical protein
MQEKKHKVLTTSSSFVNANRRQMSRNCLSLKHIIEKIDSDYDNPLFILDADVIGNWAQLVRMMEVDDLWSPSEEEIEAKHYEYKKLDLLVNRMAFFKKFYKLHKDYTYKLKRIMENCNYKLNDRDSITSDAIDAISAGDYKQALNTEDVNQYLKDLNGKSLKARSATYSVLVELQQVLLAIMNRGKEIALSCEPKYQEIADAFDNDVWGRMKVLRTKLLREMKEDLNRHYKARRTDPYTPELWEEMFDAEENALKLAINQELLTCDDVKQEHWNEIEREQMEDNGELMYRIYTSCSTDDFFDFSKPDVVQSIIPHLTPDNVKIFYYIIVRRSIIQSEMYPKLKAQLEERLNEDREQQMNEEQVELNMARLSKLDDIIGILQRGNWKQPATTENITLFLNTVFGKDTSHLDDGDVWESNKMWALIESGRGDRTKIVSANLAGFFADENLLNGTSKEISNELFGNNNQINSINDGKKNNRSIAFENTIPFLSKYINIIIRQE